LPSSFPLGVRTIVRRGSHRAEQTRIAVYWGSRRFANCRFHQVIVIETSDSQAAVRWARMTDPSWPDMVGRFPFPSDPRYSRFRGGDRGCPVGHFFRKHRAQRLEPGVMVASVADVWEVLFARQERAETNLPFWHRLFDLIDQMRSELLEDPGRENEPAEIFPFLGCSRLEEPLNREANNRQARQKYRLAEPLRERAPAGRCWAQPGIRIPVRADDPDRESPRGHREGWERRRGHVDDESLRPVISGLLPNAVRVVSVAGEFGDAGLQGNAPPFGCADVSTNSPATWPLLLRAVGMRLAPRSVIV